MDPGLGAIRTWSTLIDAVARQTPAPLPAIALYQTPGCSLIPRWVGCLQRLWRPAPGDPAGKRAPLRPGLIVEAACMFACGVASFELVLAFCKQAQQRKKPCPSPLQQRFRVPPRTGNLPDLVIPKHLAGRPMNHLLPGAPLSGRWKAARAAASNSSKLARSAAHGRPARPQPG